MATALRTISDLRGKHVAITGACWITRRRLSARLRKVGARIAKDADVTHATDILIRGVSTQWKYGTHGKKEMRAREYRDSGQTIRVVRDSAIRRLLEEGKSASFDPYIDGTPVEWTGAPSEKEFRKAASIEGPLDQRYSAKGRVEQAYLRRLLLNKRRQAPCSLCGRELPEGLLIAAHIKARRECTRAERLNPRVAFLLCLLGCDALYERGYVTVGDKGRIIASHSRGYPKSLADALRYGKQRSCPSWDSQSREFFEWHSLNQFEKMLS